MERRRDPLLLRCNEDDDEAGSSSGPEGARGARRRVKRIQPLVGNRSIDARSWLVRFDQSQCLLLALAPSESYPQQQRRKQQRTTPRAFRLDECCRVVVASSSTQSSRGFFAGAHGMLREFMCTR